MLPNESEDEGERSSTPNEGNEVGALPLANMQQQQRGWTHPERGADATLTEWQKQQQGHCDL